MGCVQPRCATGCPGGLDLWVRWHLPFTVGLPRSHYPCPISHSASTRLPGYSTGSPAIHTPTTPALSPAAFWPALRTPRYTPHLPTLHPAFVQHVFTTCLPATFGCVVCTHTRAFNGSLCATFHCRNIGLCGRLLPRQCGYRTVAPALLCVLHLLPPRPFPHAACWPPASFPYLPPHTAPTTPRLRLTHLPYTRLHCVPHAHALLPTTHLPTAGGLLLAFHACT